MMPVHGQSNSLAHYDTLSFTLFQSLGLSVSEAKSFLLSQVKVRFAPIRAAAPTLAAASAAAAVDDVVLQPIIMAMMSSASSLGWQ